MIKIPDSRTANFNFRKIFSKLHFLGLDDTPKSYRGQGGKGIMVREDERGLTFGLPSGSLIGEGSAGQVTVWDDDNALAGYDDLFFDSTNKRLGIRDTTPEFALDIGSDGGIIAKGAFGEGATLQTSGAGTRLIWYPRKSAFRVGTVSDNEWDDENIGLYSAVIGGFDNGVNAQYGAILGGYSNFINANSFTSVVIGGLSNQITILPGHTSYTNSIISSEECLVDSASASTIICSKNSEIQASTPVAGTGNFLVGEKISLVECNYVAMFGYSHPDILSVNELTNCFLIYGKNVGIQDIAPDSLLSIAGKFKVDSDGNLILINNVAYSFPAVGGVGYFYRDADGNVTFGAGGVGNHNLLDGDVHPDTIIGAVTRGGLVVGQFDVDVKWKLLTLGSLGQVLYSDGTDAIWAQLSHTKLSDIGTNTHTAIDTFVSSKGQANGLASLNASTLVVQNPASATATPTASKIPIADASAKLNGWITPALLRSANDWSGFPQKTTLVDDDIILVEDSENVYEKAWILFKDFRASLGL